MWHLIVFALGAGLLWLACNSWLETITTRGESYAVGVSGGSILGRWVAGFFGAGLWDVAVGHPLGEVLALGVVLVLKHTAKKVATQHDVDVRAASDMLATKRAEQAAVARATAAKIIEEKRVRGPVIRLGVATGKLRQRGHQNGLPRGYEMLIDAEAAYGGLVATGPMGSGKTRGIAQSWIAHWLKFESAGLFAFGVKPNWSQRIVAISLQMGRTPSQIHVVGPGHEPWPLISGLEPDAVAGFVSEAFRAHGIKGGGSQFFDNSATNLTRRAAMVLYHATRGAGKPLVTEVRAKNGEIIKKRTLTYDLNSIAEVCHMLGDDDAEGALQTAVTGRVAELVALGRADDAEDMQEAHTAMVRLVSGLKDDTRGGVVGQIDTVIEPFISSRPLRKAFCGSEDFDLGHALDDGGVVVLDVDLGKYSAASFLVYLLAFESMRRLMNARIAALRNGPLNPIGFMADEYADVATPSHMRMWRLSREAEIAPVLMYQLQSDLQNHVGGKDAGQALVGGMKTKVFFSTEDPTTVSMISGMLGSVDRRFTTTTTSEGESHSPGAGTLGDALAGNSTPTSTSKNESTSETIQRREVVDAQVMHGLTNRMRHGVPPGEQIAEVVILSEGEDGRRVADICNIIAWDPSPEMMAKAGMLLDGEVEETEIEDAPSGWAS